MTTGSLTAPAVAPAALFDAFDSFSGTPKTSAVTGKKGATVESGGESTISLCTSIEEVHRALSVSADVDGSYGPTSVGVKATYVSDLRLTETSVAVVVHAYHVLGRTDIQTAELAVDPPTADNLLQFYREHGDCWVDSITYGAEYWATYVFRSTTRDEQQAITTSLTGSTSFGGLSASTNLSVAISDATKSTKVSSSLSQKILGLSEAVPAEDGIKDYALAFTGKPIGAAPAVVDFSTRPYGDLHLPDPSVFEPIRRSRVLLVSTNPSADTFTSRQYRLTALTNALTDISNLYTAYGYDADEPSADVSALAASDQTTLNNFLATMADDPTQDRTLPETPSLSYGTPAPNISIATAPIRGGGGGNLFDGPGRSDVLDFHQHFQTSTTRRANDLISSLYVGYVRNDGTQPGFTYGYSNDGDNGGPLSINVNQGEYVTEVSTASDDHLNGLLLVTSLDQRNAVGVWNRTTTTSQTFDHSKEYFLGFAGRSDRWVDGIEVVTCTFAPAHWS